MIEFFVAFALHKALAQEPPQIVAPATTLSECLDIASKLNASDKIVRDPIIKQAGGRFICLRIAHGV